VAVTGWCGTNLIVAHAQGQPPPDRPAVTVRGQTYTPRSILARNMGTEQDQTTQFPPHKVVGNLYYVGTRTLSAFLITTPQGQGGGANPFVDAENCDLETDIQEAMFRAALDESPK
jgi:hypothetical protein